MIKGGQSVVHQDLAAKVQRHIDSDWLKPIADHSLRAFEETETWLSSRQGSLILDSGCGTGESTRNLALQHPDGLVVGIDRSQHRLSRHGVRVSDNYMMVRADLNDFWRLAGEAGWRCRKHYLLYPNPYPKAAQFNKRWYGSPAFPALLSLAGELTVRTNWPLYVEEFALALKLCGVAVDCHPYAVNQPMTPFERKYTARSETLWELRADLDRLNNDGI